MSADFDYICARCRDRTEAARPPARCRACGCPGPLRRVVPPDPMGRVGGFALDEIADVPVEHLPTPWPQLTAALGGGWMRGGIYLLAGAPGAGKSRLALQCLQAATDTRALYVYAEGGRLVEPKRWATDVGATRAGIRMAHATSWESARAQMEARVAAPDGLDLVALDSLARLSLDKLPPQAPRGYDDPSVVAWDLGRWSMQPRHAHVVVLLLHHSNKQGGAHGSQHIGHEATGGVLEFSWDKNDPRGPRSLVVGKNRSGPGGALDLCMVDPGKLALWTGDGAA